MDLFHHCLHGYSNKKGHHKIASSCSLTFQSEQTMLSMSDRSGSFCTGFKEYITLYQLTSEKKYNYALAKTWEATEIRRPGCVWTHTILFTEEQKDAIQDLHSLVKFFRHPLKPKQIEASFYEENLSIPINDITNNPDISTVNISKKDIIRACLHDKRPILILAESSNIYERVIFEIWSKRKDFTFCTGSLAIRKVDDNPIKVQVVPKKLSYRSEVYFINQQNQVIPDDSDINAAVKLYKFWDDLKVDETIIKELNIKDFIKFVVNLRSFLKKFSDETDLKQDIQFFIELQNCNETISSIIKLLHNNYPGSKNKIKLKKAFLGKNRTYLNKKTEFQFLNVFAQYNDLRSFDAEDLSIKKRTEKYWKKTNIKNKVKIVKLLLESSPKGFSNIMLEKIIHIIDMDTTKLLILDQKNGFTKDQRENLLINIVNIHNDFYRPMLDKLKNITSLQNRLIEEFTPPQEANTQTQITKPDISEPISIEQRILQNEDINSLIEEYGMKKIMSELKELEEKLAFKKFGEIDDLSESDIIDFLDHTGLNIKAGRYITEKKLSNMAELILNGKRKTKKEYMIYFLSIGFKCNYSLLVAKSFQFVLEELYNDRIDAKQWDFLKATFRLPEDYISYIENLKHLSKKKYLHLYCQLLYQFADNQLDKKYLFHTIKKDTKILKKRFKELQVFLRVHGIVLTKLYFFCQKNGFKLKQQKIE